MKGSVKVVLLEDVAGLGKAGETRDVARGYARNFLLPRKVAVEASAGLLKQLADKQVQEERQQKKKIDESRGLAERLSALTLTFKVKVGEQHRLFGSVTAKDIADALQAQTKSEVDRRWVQLEDPIRALGTYDVPLRLSASAQGTVKVVVEPE